LNLEIDAIKTNTYHSSCTESEMVVGNTVTHSTIIKSVCNTHDCTELQEPKNPQERSLETVSFPRSYVVSLSVSGFTGNHADLVGTVLGRWWRYTQSMHNSNRNTTTITTTVTTTRRDTTTIHATATDVTVCSVLCRFYTAFYILESFLYSIIYTGHRDLSGCWRCRQ
jgi:hypothetical protein